MGVVDCFITILSQDDTCAVGRDVFISFFANFRWFNLGFFVSSVKLKNLCFLKKILVFNNCVSILSLPRLKS